MIITTATAPRNVVLAVTFLAILLPAPCFGVLFVQGYTAQRHDRFANHVDFLASQSDLSGVGRADAGWVTLLQNPSGGAPEFFASAHHAQPSGSVSFFSGNDPTATPVTCTVAPGGTRIGLSDIWIGALDLTTCDTSSLTAYEVATTSPTNHVGDTILQAGISTLTYAAGVPTTNMRFGRNKVTSFEQNTTFISRTGDWVIYADDSASGDLLGSTATVDNLDPDETAFFGGDSGGPSFLVEASGTLKLFGIHSFRGEYITTDADGDGNPDLDSSGAVIETPTRRLSGDAYLPTSRSAILATITAVPEPNAGAMLTLVAVGVLLVRVAQRAGVA